MAFQLLLGLLALTLFTASTAALIEQTWVIDYKFVAPDGVEKVVPVVNQQLPGPTLRGHVGDRVRIRVINKLSSESTSIHWHGVKQLGTPWSDGVPGITQCAIRPRQEFMYEFTLDSPGTLWWHSHSGMQKSSLHGLIIVTGDEERIGQCGARDVNLILGDWFHASSAEQVAGLHEKLPNPFRWVGDAQSILIQGRGMFNCSDTTKKCDPKHPDAGLHIIDVDSKSRYRLRIAGATLLSNLNIGIDAHELKVVEAETTLTRPLTVKYLDVGSTNSYSAMLTTLSKNELDLLAPGHNGLFWIQANVRHRKKGARGLAILRYSFASRKETRPAHPPPSDWPGRNDVNWSLAQARALKALSPVTVPPPDKRIVLLGTQNRHADGSLVWAMNNMSFVPQRTPLIQSAKFGITEEMRHWRSATKIPVPYNYSKTLEEANLSIMAKRAPHVIRVAKGDVIEVVLQNTVNLGGSEEIHPWVRSPRTATRGQCDT